MTLLSLCLILSGKRISILLSLMNDKVVIRYGGQSHVACCLNTQTQAPVKMQGLSETSFSTFLRLRHVCFIAIMCLQSLKFPSKSDAPCSSSPAQLGTLQFTASKYVINKPNNETQTHALKAKASCYEQNPTSLHSPVESIFCFLCPLMIGYLNQI